MSVSDEETDVFDALNQFCNEIVISEEKHKNGDTHHHLYLRTINDFTRFEIKKIISHLYNLNPVLEINEDTGDIAAYINDCIYVATVRNVNNYLKYITKEDPDPKYKGFEIEKKFSFYFRAVNWAKEVDEFDITDPFVLSHPNYYKLLKEVKSKTIQKQSKKNLKRLKPVSMNVDKNWKKQVVEWWNDWVNNGWEHKKSQLYLWGPPGVGKTHFINDLLRKSISDPGDEEDAYENQIFFPTPCDRNFGWQQFDPNKHNLMMIDEFDIKEYNLSALKKILAGETLVANCKGNEPINIRLRMPSILISNFKPPDNTTSVEYTGFYERIIEVFASP